MDFWDLTKLLVRRWMIVVPMLLLSGTLAVLTLFAVKPDYTATAHIQLVPPITGATLPGQATPDQRNPWIGLGLQALGNAAIVTVTDQSVLDQMHSEGFTDSYTATMAETSPLITFEIVAKSPVQAQATTQELVNRFNASVSDLQAGYHVAAADTITARRLDMGTTVVKSSSKIKRAVVAVGGAGLLMTAGVTVGVDAWLSRRRRRREEAAAGAKAADTTQRVTLAPIGKASRVPAAPDKPVPVRAPAEPVGRRVSSLDATAIIPVSNGHGAAGAGKDGAEAGVPLAQPVAGWSTIDVGDDEQQSEQALPMSSDATIVLPLPLSDRGQQWMRQSGKKS